MRRRTRVITRHARRARSRSTTGHASPPVRRSIRAGPGRSRSTAWAAGVDPTACGDGFEPDADGACGAVLPADACPKGTMAVPGDASCRRIAPCDGTWGSAPLDATTEYVDGSYAGGDSDGTAARPWTTIQAAVDAAASSAVVAISAGSYAEDVVVNGKAVRLWGRCPADVEITGAVSQEAISIGKGATGTELHDLAVTGAASAILLSGAEEVVVERVWLHDLAGAGLAVFGVKGPTAAQLRGSLVEAAAQGGILVGGATVTVEESVVRDTSIGYGFEIHDAAALTVRRALIERNAEFGVAATASDVTLDGVVVRDTKPSAWAISDAASTSCSTRTPARAASSRSPTR